MSANGRTDPKRGSKLRAFLADTEQRREAITMALYVSISLLSVMLALPSDIGPEESHRPALAVFLTSMGLMLAHALASRISTRLVHGEMPAHVLAILLRQLTGGVAVTAVAVLPIMLIGSPDGVRVAEYLLIGFVALTAYAAARAGAMSRLRSVSYVLGVVVVSLAVLWVKALGSH